MKNGTFNANNDDGVICGFEGIGVGFDEHEPDDVHRLGRATSAQATAKTPNAWRT